MFLVGAGGMSHGVPVVHKIMGNIQSIALDELLSCRTREHSNSRRTPHAFCSASSGLSRGWAPTNTLELGQERSDTVCQYVREKKGLASRRSQLVERPNILLWQ